MDDTTKIVQRLGDVVEAIEGIECTMPDVSDIERRLKNIEALLEKIERKTGR